MSMNASVLDPVYVGVCFVFVRLCVYTRRIVCLCDRGSCPGAGDRVCCACLCASKHTCVCVCVCVYQRAEICLAVCEVTRVCIVWGCVCFFRHGWVCDPAGLRVYGCVPETLYASALGA